ncbi:Sulfate transporter 3.1 [Bienertia sinuspersici]
MIYFCIRIMRWIDEEEERLKLSGDTNLHYVILDMRAVTCIDTSGIVMFDEVNKIIDRTGFQPSSRRHHHLTPTPPFPVASHHHGIANPVAHATTVASLISISGRGRWVGWSKNGGEGNGLVEITRRRGRLVEMVVWVGFQEGKGTIENGWGGQKCEGKGNVIWGREKVVENERGRGWSGRKSEGKGWVVGKERGKGWGGRKEEGKRLGWWKGGGAAWKVEEKRWLNWRACVSKSWRRSDEKLDRAEFFEKLGQEWVHLTIGEAVGACRYMLHTYKSKLTDESEPCSNNV